ncbi:Uncharacterised protein [[Clostridium] sordellii]|uniref:Lipoprotein n=1 Tax=Paraclostridium sordellii TaxID=1505 RepID=A0ABP1XP18_PARSO|nr:hypothetical protein [Paeniclostridium sordellii]CEJ73095.1 putative lipoprotein [[Clostridium] sordellii] [Paeniclostridium sordellii]CEN68648.1 Uncharacterised protein [[Clostridium] sordellii] [Paeniclostridium sordellii]CEN71915.1 Uncharacterised protein [[Clostridium] sordellii] [Paeniclostridium sordellii]CEO22691.1 Uncharacterised protein [[Clostridium] sordellii] [Paeniclostridium sordellii]CEP76492.1 Uncharacterised protein [[Clostridium] sordellii] [Paeniclostridium sordellii]
MKKIYIVLAFLMIITLSGCSSSNEKDSKEESKQVINKDKKDSKNDFKEVINNNEEVSKEVKNVEETYPQSIAYFAVLNKLENIKNKDEATNLLSDLQSYIVENYPYDYSQAKDKPILETLEDFGLMEKLLIVNNDHMFYEATNHKNTIGLNYYAKGENDVRNNNIIVTTDDFQLQNKVCKNNIKELKIHAIYESVLKELVKNSDIDKKLKEIEEKFKDYEKKEMNDDIVVYKFNKDKEYLTLAYSKVENKIKNLNYSNNESLSSESAYIKDGKLEIRIINKVDDLSEQEKLFNEVLGS